MKVLPAYIVSAVERLHSQNPDCKEFRMKRKYPKPPFNFECGEDFHDLFESALAIINNN